MTNRQRQQQRGLRNLCTIINKVAPSGTIPARLLGVLAYSVNWYMRHPADDDEGVERIAAVIRDGFGPWQQWDGPGGRAIARALRQVYGIEGRKGETQP